MRIEISRSGGFAGMTRTWTLEVSPAEAEERWLPLAGQAAGNQAQSGAGGTAPGPPGTGGTGGQAGRDRYVYHFTIGYQEVVLPESGLDEPWKELIDRARRESKG